MLQELKSLYCTVFGVYATSSHLGQDLTAYFLRNSDNDLLGLAPSSFTRDCRASERHSVRRWRNVPAAILYCLLTTHCHFQTTSLFLLQTKTSNFTIIGFLKAGRAQSVWRFATGRGRDFTDISRLARRSIDLLTKDFDGILCVVTINAPIARVPTF